MKPKAKPTGAAVIIWRDLAEEGYTYAEIHRKYPKFTVNQIRHYCLGNTGRKLPGPIQASGRWLGHNVWLQGEKSPHAGMTQAQALEVLADWDGAKGRWKRSASYWAKTLSVSPSAIQQLRRGDTWQHLDHPNQRRNREKREQKALEKAQLKAQAKAQPKAPEKTPARKPVRKLVRKRR